jgi:hypothetical protein
VSKFTPGPWRAELTPASVWDWTVMAPSGKGRTMQIGIDTDNTEADASLIAAAPAMDMVLSLVALGMARIERSASGALVEFCFKGIRYCHNGDWSALIDVVGWDRCRQALAEAA